MSQSEVQHISAVLSAHEDEILASWLAQQTGSSYRRSDLIGDAEVRSQCQEFLRLLRDTLSKDETANIQSASWEDMRSLLSEIALSRAQQGFTPEDVAAFVFSIKEPLFAQLQHGSESSGESLFDEIWIVTRLLDSLGLFTVEANRKSREQIIIRQQEEMLELSTPVVKLWDGILALPIIGTLDSARTQIVMENLLQAIVDTESEIAIIDITAVPTVDTLTSQHLLKTVAAARLMGAECIISGIRPQIAQTIVHLGVDLSVVTTKATLADAFSLALKRLGRALPRTEQVKA